MTDRDDGYGDGYGSGYGYGDGSGYGYGSGDGYGYGYGDGSGYGSGDGSGSGYGCGSGYGDGYGYGDGSGYWALLIPVFAEKWPETTRARYAVLKMAGVRLAYWRSDAAGKAANGGSGVIAEAGVIHKAPGPLNLCHEGTLHATLIPPKWEGERWWIVALHGDVVGDDEKFGCLEREIVGECL